MSRYDWESGTIKIPTKVFARFRKDFIDGYNSIQLRKLDTLKAWREIALREGKGKRNYDFKDRMIRMTNGYEEEVMVDGLFTFDNNKPKMPTRKMFNFVNGKTDHFNVDESSASISFNRADKTVTWSVYENNHACESARGTKEASLLFGLLNKVDFTRGSGGTIIGNDEYNRDDYCEGGGGNYVTATYGKQKKQSRWV